MNLEPGYFYHIYNRGNKSQKVFYSHNNYLFFLNKMNAYIKPFASIIAWCLMPNHFHWVIFIHKNEIELISNPSHAMTSRHSMTTRKGSDSLTTKNICIIGIGSNINAEENIPKMLEILKAKVKVLQISSLIKTKPIGIINQPDFTNGAVKVETDLNKTKLNKLLKDIENSIGRDRTKPKFSSRCIDIDIIVWNGEIVDKDYYTRDFLQKSVSELTK